MDELERMWRGNISFPVVNLSCARTKSMSDDEGINFEFTRCVLLPSVPSFCELVSSFMFQFFLF